MNLAIIDDETGDALDSADWDDLGVPATVFDAPFSSDDEIVAKLREFEIICTMSGQTAFPAELLPRLPKLKLIVTTGMKSPTIDVMAANLRGIMVCGTPPPEDDAEPETPYRESCASVAAWLEGKPIRML